MQVHVPVPQLPHRHTVPVHAGRIRRYGYGSLTNIDFFLRKKRTIIASMLIKRFMLIKRLIQ